MPSVPQGPNTDPTMRNDGSTTASQSMSLIWADSSTVTLARIAWRPVVQVKSSVSATPGHAPPNAPPLTLAVPLVVTYGSGKASPDVKSIHRPSIVPPAP